MPSDKYDIWNNKLFPYPQSDGSEKRCEHDRTKTVVLGNEYQTDITLFRFVQDSNVTLSLVNKKYPNHDNFTATKIVLTTLTQAFIKAGVLLLDLEIRDIDGGFRIAISEGGKQGKEYEIFLFDQASGGAGFVRKITEQIDDFIALVFTILDGCDCESSWLPESFWEFDSSSSSDVS